MHPEVGPWGHRVREAQLGFPLLLLQEGQQVLAVEEPPAPAVLQERRRQVEAALMLEVLQALELQVQLRELQALMLQLMCLLML